MPPPEMSRAEQALAAVEAGNAAAVEEHWLACLEGGAAADPLLPRVADRLVARRERDRAVTLLQMTVGALEQAGKAGAAFPLLARLAKLTPDEPGLRDRLLAAAGTAFAGRPTAMVVQTLRLEGSSDVRTLVDQLEAAVRFAPGDVVRHQGGWGLGRVTEIDAAGLQLRIQFLDGGLRAFPVLTAGRFLTWVPPEAFDHLVVAAPERLKAEATSDPAGLIRRLLADRAGRLPQREIKLALVKAGICTADSWTRFWGAARRALTADPYVELPGGPNGQVRLRERPVARGDEIVEGVRRATDLGARLRAVRQALGQPEGRAVVQRLADEMVTEARALPRDAIASRVAIAEVMETLAAAGATVTPPVDVAALAADRAQAAAVLAKLPDAEARSAFLVRVRAAHRDGWIAVSAGVLDAGAEAEVGDELLATAAAAGQAPALLQAVAKSVNDRQNPTATLWACGAVLDGRVGGGAPLPDAADLVARALALVTRASADAEWSRDPAPRLLLRRARGALPVKGLLKFLEGRPETEMARLLRAVLNCTGLGPRFLTDVERWCMANHPKLLAQESLETGGVPNDAILVSPAGLARYEAEFANLMNVEFPKNAQDLGEAIAKGDLSENAEYEAARQRQQWLVARGGQMRADLEKARPIELAAINADRVVPGAQVSLRADDGRTQAYTILGPWDVDVDRGIISYLSPMGQAVLGRRAGETVRVRLPEGDQIWQVVAVTPLREFPAPRAPRGPAA